MNKSLISLTVLLSLLLTGCSDGPRMRRHLAELEAVNKADSLMHSDSLAEAVARYFDSHGSPNERVRAYYMLGRTYHDMGETPKAIEAYNSACDQADTLAPDCNYHVLCRVHAQKAALFIQQYMPNETLRELDDAIRYAYLDGDSLTALICYENKIKAFNQLGLRDSIYAVADSLYNSPYRHLAVNSLSSAIYYLIQEHKIEKAKRFLDICLSEIDTAQNTNNRVGMLYSNMGFYHLNSNRLDSAIAYFNRQLRYSQWLNNRVMAGYGLFKAYLRLGIKDSAMKYAELYNTANDSSNIFESADRLQRMQSLYRYERSEKKAALMAHEAQHMGQMLWWIAGLSVAVIVIVVLLTALYVRTKREEGRIRLIRLNQDYNDLLLLYSQAKADINLLQQSDSQNHELIKAKQEEICQLQLKMAQYQGIQSAESGWQFDDDILNDPLVRKLHKQAAQGQTASDADMQGLVELTYHYAPQFFEKLSHLSPELSQKRTYICMLAKLRFAPAAVASLMGLSAQAVSNHRSFLSKTLFHCPTTDFDFKIRQI